VHHIEAKKLKIMFDQGCLFDGASFIISKSGLKAPEHVLSNVSKKVHTCSEMFLVKIPYRNGTYVIECTDKDTMPYHHYSLEMFTTCKKATVQADVRIVEYSTVHDNFIEVGIPDYLLYIVRGFEISILFTKPIARLTHLGMK